MKRCTDIRHKQNTQKSGENIVLTWCLYLVVGDAVCSLNLIRREASGVGDKPRDACCVDVRHVMWGCLWLLMNIWVGRQVVRFWCWGSLASPWGRWWLSWGNGWLQNVHHASCWKFELMARTKQTARNSTRGRAAYKTRMSYSVPFGSCIIIHYQSILWRPKPKLQPPRRQSNKLVTWNKLHLLLLVTQ